MNKKGQKVSGSVIIIVVLICITLLIGGIFTLKATGPWWSEVTGKSSLREAQWSKQIVIEEAKAELESAELKREADVIRAKGTAEANEIIAKSLTDRKSTRLNSSHIPLSRMPSSA